MDDSEDNAPPRKTLAEGLARIAQIQAKAKAEKQGEGEPVPAAPVKSNVVQLPLWPEAVRAVPNGFLRSALFGAIGKGKRRYMQGELVAAVDGVEIRYTGQRLDQGDLDVWESVLHAVRLQELGGQCRLTSYALLKLMGKTDTGKNRVILQSRIERLVANAVNVKQGRYTYIGNLIAGAAKDEETQAWVIELNPKLRPLFATDQFTQVEWSVRQELTGHQLAQWLHGFFASHAKPFPVKVETLHRLCGSEATLMSDFAKSLRKALDALTEASEANGQPFGYVIDGDLVHVQKKPSGTQRLHLAKKAKQAQKRKVRVPFQRARPYRSSAPGRTVPAPPSYRSSDPAVPFQRPRRTVPAPPKSSSKTGRNASTGAGLRVLEKPC